MYCHPYLSTGSKDMFLKRETYVDFWLRGGGLRLKSLGTCLLKSRLFLLTPSCLLVLPARFIGLKTSSLVSRSRRVNCVRDKCALVKSVCLIMSCTCKNYNFNSVRQFLISSQTSHTRTISGLSNLITPKIPLYT